MTKLTMVFEEKDYGADLNVEFEGNVKDIASAFGSLEYELIKKLVEKKGIKELKAVDIVAKTSMNVVSDYIIDDEEKIRAEISEFENNAEMHPGMSMPTVLMAALGMGFGFGFGCTDPVDSKRFRH